MRNKKFIETHKSIVLSVKKKKKKADFYFGATK
jgi:hypothetical protein